MERVKVRSTVTAMGLEAGQEAEIDLTDVVRAFLRSGLFLLLRPIGGQNISE